MWRFPLYAGLPGLDLTTSARCVLGCQVAHGQGYMGLGATTWVPMGASTSTHPRGDRRVSRKLEFSKIFSRRMLA